jgi:hypothetical protein
MPLMRRARGALLRFARRRRASTGAGIALLVPVAVLRFGVGDSPWWAEGLGVVVGASGLALLWTGLMGVRPDWEDGEKR